MLSPSITDTANKLSRAQQPCMPDTQRFVRDRFPFRYQQCSLGEVFSLYST